ncbi:polysaccharide deacetylase family protein [Salinimicrobium sp. GXAS 041]|uniref:polysaccharide deacetylase family protein n=1 Tax=Salinimicrobium sp. GXAS 041 TaxID=3400806 RepID=UPI003C74BFB3
MITRIPGFIRILFPRRFWKVATKKKVLYLTFDDGPVPEITPWVLEQLKKYQAKATFFCIGDNIRKHPNIFQQIISEDHRIGNHTHNHLNGWKTSTNYYVKNVLLGEDFISEKREQEAPRLFRPPYGRLTRKQSKILQKKNFKIVMWDVLTKDYDRSLSAEKCLKNTIKHSRPGSIIVFHDSIKASGNLKIVLPKVLAHFSTQGYRFEKL